MTEQEFEDAIKHPKTYSSKQETIDGIYPIVEYAIKHLNMVVNINGRHFDLSKIITNKPDINDEKNVFAMFMLYNKLIGEPVIQTIINK
ncbi:MAG: hypothetical protein M0R17_04845 [Candidatus Omnitrophica bacterium]|jgi:hypothetical protein|nr:hypothetical protein [Candidatus Omnitrophota bacterium]